MKNKIIALLLILGLQVGMVNISASSINDWDSYGGNITNSKVNYAKLSENLSAKFNNKKNEEQTNFKLVEKGDVKEPIIVKDKVYVVKTKGKGGKSSLLEFNLTGELLSETPLSGSTLHFSRITYGNNKIFIPLNNMIEAIDIETKESVWTTKTTNYQMISSLLYYNGYLYSGASAQTGDIDAPTNGYFFAINVKEKEANLKNGHKGYAWTWQEENKQTGFYWSSPVIVNNSVVFVGDSGDVISHHLTKPEVYDSYKIKQTSKPNKSRSNIYYNKENETIYVGTQDSKKLISLKMKNQNFIKTSIKEIDAGVQLSGGIKGDGENLFASSGGMKANGGLINTDLNLNKKNGLTTAGTQSLPLVNKGRKDTLIYYVDYQNGELVTAKKDAKGNLVQIDDTGKNLEKESTLGENNSNSIIANENGLMIVPLSAPSKSGLMFINTNEKYTAIEMEELIKSIPNTIKYSDKDMIESIEYQYKKSNLNLSNDIEDILNNAKTQYASISTSKVAEVKSSIDALPTSLNGNKETLKDEITKIREVDSMFNALNVEDQLEVDNHNKLDKILERADQKEYGIEPQELVKRIDKLSNKNNRLIDLKEVYEIEAEYNGVYYTEELRKEVTNHDKLLKIKAELEAIGNDVYKVTRVIENLPQKITVNNDKEIQEALDIYKNLSNENREDANKGFKLEKEVEKEIEKETEKETEIIDVQVSNGDYEYLLDCNKELIRLKSVVTKGKYTYYYKLVDEKWFNYQMVYRNGKSNTTYYYALDKSKLAEGYHKPGNGARLTKAITKNGSNTTTNLYQDINKVTKIYRTTTINRYKGKNITTYSRSISYYSNGRTKIDTKLYKSYKTNKMTSKNKTTYFSTGKKSVYIKFNYKNGKFSSRNEYRYNKQGQTKSNKYGKAYRYTTYYNKKGKATKTLRYQYKSNGKTNKAKKVGKRNSF
ncbi:MAG: hypothetical protein RR425_02040 [Erysipelotrichales bacterium]